MASPIPNAPMATRARHPLSLFGIQTWVALPEGAEDGAAGFQHVAESAICPCWRARAKGCG
jgi:redox-sensitive bicupin YhaK (pirin superfamily)